MRIRTRSHRGAGIMPAAAKPKTVLLATSGVVAVIVAGLCISPLVSADNLQQQIDALENQNAVTRQSVNQLGAQAAGLTDTITRLQGQIANLQAQIQENDTKRVETVAKIAQAEADLAKQKDTLSQNLKKMYVDGQMSTTEMLATSKSLSDFVDQRQYQNAVQSSIQRTLEQINALKAQLGQQQATLERIIADQKTMQADLANQKAEQNRLLSLNQAQQAELDGQIKTNTKKANDLREQQRIENLRLGGGGKIPAGTPGGGGYPGVWAFAPMDSMLDSWGMYNRECVSYTAYKVAASGRYMPYWGGIGNANQWDDNARRAGIPVDTNPRAGDVAVKNSGYYGHVMYVEAVGSDGSINVSDYNQQLDGLYRNYWISASSVAANNLQFIHF